MSRPLRLAVLALVALGLVLAGCSDDDGGGGATATTAAATPSTTAAPATTTTAAVQQAPPGQPPTDPTDTTAQQATQRLIDAWTAGDLNAAVAIVGSDVANALFAHPAPQQAVSQPCRGSETEVGAIECDYSSADGVVTLVVTGNAGNGYRVTNVGFIPA